MLQKRRYNLITGNEAPLNTDIAKITDTQFLANLLVDLRSSDAHACYTALVTLRVSSQQGILRMFLS